MGIEMNRGEERSELQLPDKTNVDKAVDSEVPSAV
jgi:hypothetical protein